MPIQAITPVTSPTQQLKNALLEKNERALRTALDLGADPNGDGNIVGRAPYSVTLPLEFAIRNHYPKGFLSALIEAGAWTDEVRNNGRLKFQSPLAVAAQVGNEPAIDALLSRRQSFDINTEEWRACMESKKPARWIARFLAHDARPPQGTALMMLGKAVSMGSLKSMDLLLDAVPLHEDWIVDEHIMQGALKNQTGFRQLLLIALSRDTSILDKLHANGKGIVPSFAKVKWAGKTFGQSLANLLSIPELAGEIGMRWSERNVLEVILEQSSTLRKLYPVAIAAGAKFSEIKPDERMEDYLERTVPTMMHQLRTTTPKGFAADTEKWLRHLWACAQADQMDRSAPVPKLPQRPGRRI